MTRYLVTSALPYVNGELHLGHLVGCILPADVYSRFLKLKGEDCIYVCGTDEHGTPIQVAAEKEGITPKQLADKYYVKQKEAIERFNISTDIFSRTTTPEHVKVVQDFYYKLKQGNYIFRKEIEQLYCEKCGRFLPDRYVEGKCPYCGAEGARGDQCDSCGKPLEPNQLIDPHCVTCGSKPVIRKTEHVFFDMPKVQEKLYSWLENHEGLFPNAKRFALAFVKQGLKPVDISRDIEWGVPIPDAEGLVFYVWFDAPIGYITFTKQLGRANWWTDKNTKLVQFLGKDNIFFHTVYFPSMLIAAEDYILPYKIASYEFLTFGGSKLSKSKGRMIKALEALEVLPADYWRFVLLSLLPEKKDSDLTWELMQEIVNSELNDTIGNFVHRTLTFAEKFFNKRVKKPELTEEDKQFVEEIVNTVKRVEELFYNIELKQALHEVLKLVRKGNQYITANEPWKREDRRQAVVYVSLCLVKSLSVLLKPFIPETADKIKSFLELDEQAWDDAKEFPEEFVVGEFKPLFRKMTDEEVAENIKRFSVKKEKEGSGMIKYDDFAKLDLRIGEVINAEKVEGADKLLKLTVKIGGEERTLVAGIAPYYSKDELIGKKIVVLTNLEPKKIRGIESQGMLLAAVDEQGKVSLLTVDKEVNNGAKVE